MQRRVSSKASSFSPAQTANHQLLPRHRSKVEEEESADELRGFNWSVILALLGGIPGVYAYLSLGVKEPLHLLVLGIPVLIGLFGILTYLPAGKLKRPLLQIYFVLTLLLLVGDLLVFVVMTYISWQPPEDEMSNPEHIAKTVVVWVNTALQSVAAGVLMISTYRILNR